MHHPRLSRQLCIWPYHMVGHLISFYPTPDLLYSSNLSSPMVLGDLSMPWCLCLSPVVDFVLIFSLFPPWNVVFVASHKSVIRLQIIFFRFLGILVSLHRTGGGLQSCFYIKEIELAYINWDFLM